MRPAGFRSRISARTDAVVGEERNAGFEASQCHSVFPHISSGLEEGEEVGVELVPARIAEAVRSARIDLQDRVFDEF
jgi:hypothetical protein